MGDRSGSAGRNVPVEGRLSAVLLGDLRVETADCAIVELGAGGVLGCAAERASVFHLVLDGQCWLRPPGKDPTILSGGDCALLFYGGEHRIAAGRRMGGGERLDLADDLHLTDVPPVIRIGAAGAVKARLLSARLRYAYLSPAAFANRSGPDCRIARAEPRSGEERVLSIDRGQVAASLAAIGGTAFATMLVSLLLVPMLRGAQQELWRERSIEVRTPITRRVGAAIHAMQAQPERAWTVADLARAVGLSRSTFAAAFTSHTGEAPLAYLTRIRMERAADLLVRTNMPLREIARRSGYGVEHSFARAFRRHRGLSPRAYAAAAGDRTRM
jgi:AraC-like DNA-binding protein